jgi:nitrogen-specific signal transduction histidine kinase/ActR/RegA family two-component response regulator
LHHSEDEKPQIVWSVVRDVTETKKIQEMSRQSQKMEAVGQLAGGIAHDFNNMLTGIIGYTEISLDMVTQGSKLEKNLMQILKAGDRAKHLVNQILSFSRHSQNIKNNIYLRPILKEVIELLKVSIPSSVIIKTEIYKDTHTVYADPVKIHEVIMNLVTNSVHAMEEKGELTISLREECLLYSDFGYMGMIEAGEYSIIEVFDTGCGIDQETIKKIFEPFYTTKPRGKGTGMGLSVVYGIVQSHNGNIQIKTKPGHGVTFRIFFPKSEISPLKFEKNENHYVFGTENILFVDDEILLVEMAKELLSSMGYNVTATYDSAEALKIIINNPEKFDLLITDQTMPKLTGAELAKEALKLRPDLLIIMCTGYSSSINSEKAIQMGIKKFLMKPVTRNELGMAIREVFDKNGK